MLIGKKYIPVKPRDYRRNIYRYMKMRNLKTFEEVAKEIGIPINCLRKRMGIHI